MKSRGLALGLCETPPSAVSSWGKVLERRVKSRLGFWRTRIKAVSGSLTTTRNDFSADASGGGGGKQCNLLKYIYKIVSIRIIRRHATGRRAKRRRHKNFIKKPAAWALNPQISCPWPVRTSRTLRIAGPLVLLAPGLRGGVWSRHISGDRNPPRRRTFRWGE
jgi:hypothetical protein